MGRCLSLFGMMVFTLGVVALASLAKGSSHPPAPEAAPATEQPGVPGALAARMFHAPFSLN